MAYLLKEFPLKLKIAKIAAEKNGKAQELILQGGSKFGIQKGDVFSVKFIDRSLGAPLPKEIGKLKVNDVLNEFFTNCKVVAGGDQILQHFTNKDEIECLLLKE